MELKRAESGDFIEVTGDAEEIFEPLENGDGIMLDVMEREPTVESEEIKDGNGKDSQEPQELIILRAYFKDLSREPLLTPNEEIEISARIKNCEARIAEIKALIGERPGQMKKGKVNGQANSGERIISKQTEMLDASAKAYSDMAKDLKSRFIKANLRLVLKIARRYANKGIPMIDVIQEGNLGLMKAVDKFDHKRGFKFSTYASWWIRHSIIRAIMTQTETIRIPAYLLENSAKVYRTIAELDKEMGRRPIPEEIARRAGVSVNIVRRIQEKTSYTSLHSPVANGEKVTQFDVIADEGSPVPDSVIPKTELTEKIIEALSLLNPREEEIIRMRFGVNEENAVYTLRDIANKLGLTRERVRQIQNKALKKISSSELGKVLRSFRE